MVRVSGPVTRILSANIVTQALGLVSTLISAAFLDLAGFGRLTAILLWTAFIPQITSLSLPDTMIAASRHREDIPRTYANGLVITLALGLISAAILFLLSHFAVLNMSTSELVPAALLVLMTLLSANVASLEQRLQNYGLYNRVLVSTSVIVLAGLTIAVFFPQMRTISFVLWVRVTGFIIPVGLRLIIRRKYFLGRPDRRGVSLLRTSTLFHITATLNAVSTRADQMIATALLSSAQMGLLGLILPFGRATKSLAYAMSTVSLVDVVESGDYRKQQQKMEQSRRRAAVGGAVAGTVCVGAAFAVLQARSYGVGDSIAAAPVLILVSACYMASHAVGGVVDLVIRLQRGIQVVMPGIVSRVLAAFGGVVVAWYAVDAWGLIGAGIASVIISVIALVSLDAATVWMLKEKRR